MNQRLSRAKIRAMRPNEVLVELCPDVAALDSAYQNALRIKEEMADRGATIGVSRSIKTMTVTVSRLN